MKAFGIVPLQDAQIANCDAIAASFTRVISDVTVSHAKIVFFLTG